MTSMVAGAIVYDFLPTNELWELGVEKLVDLAAGGGALTLLGTKTPVLTSQPLSSNNWCENAIRPFAVGRKNWLHIGSEIAGPRVAAITSIFETCRRLGINIRDYLNDVLPRLPNWPINRVAELTPMVWAAARNLSG